MEKPVLVIIGEDHPKNVEKELISKGKLNTKDRLWAGGMRVVADVKADKGVTKANLRRISKIILKEAKIMKEKKIMRLFIEEPATVERQAIYSKYKVNHDLAWLKSNLWDTENNEVEMVVEIAKKFLLHNGVPEALANKLTGQLSLSIYGRNARCSPFRR